MDVSNATEWLLVAGILVGLLIGFALGVIED